MRLLDLRDHCLTLCGCLLLLACNDEDEPKPRPPDASTDAGALHDAAIRNPARGDAALADAGSPRAGDAGGGTRSGDGGADPVSPDPSSLKTDYAAWQAVVARMRGCDIFDEGFYPYAPGLSLRCDALCLLAASCADLRTEACDLEPASRLETCFDGCDDANVFACGDGKTVSVEVTCDLARDCASGEDEQHCEPFECASGDEQVGLDYRCDGERDCADGSDEKGCVLVCGMPYASSGI